MFLAAWGSPPAGGVEGKARLREKDKGEFLLLKKREVTKNVFSRLRGEMREGQRAREKGESRFLLLKKEEVTKDVFLRRAKTASRNDFLQREGVL